MFDCIIIGTGPAGGTAAYHLAKRGRSVLLIEKETLPRYKSCGSGVSPVIAQYFDFDLEPAISLKVNKIRYTWQLEDPVEVELKPSEAMWVINRDNFDYLLVQQAQKQGVELRDQTTVTGIKFENNAWQVSTNNGPVTGRYLIAADGATGPTAKWLGFKEVKPRLASTLEVQAPISDQPTIHFDFGTLKNGFIWNLPHANGYSINATTFQGREPQEFKSVLTSYAATTGINTAQSQMYDDVLALWNGDRPLHQQNALLVGEAAHLVDPLSGEGIRPAIFSGMKAAAAIDSALGGDLNALEQYTQTIHQEWGEDMKWAGRLAAAFYKFPGIGYKVAVKKPHATRLMSQILCGRARYSEVAGQALKRLSAGLIPGRG